MPSSQSSLPSQPGTEKKATKEKGCFQCCRRRIICDRAEPSCKKCLKKGIECSGLKRIRFTDGVARRGRLKDFKVPDIRADSATFLPTQTSFEQVRWQSDRKSGKKKFPAPPNEDFTIQPFQPAQATASQNPPRITIVGNGNLIFPAVEPDEQQEKAHSDYIGDSPLDFATPIQSWTTDETLPDADDEVEEITRVEDSMILHTYVDQCIQPWLAPLSAEARMLFSHFSETVAPAMVVLDTDTNGYRSLILPMALEDEVLRRAVGVVAAQHLSRERPEMRDAAEAGRIAIFSRLRKNAMTEAADSVFNRFTWATLLVLLVGETVTGSADYGFLVQMLLCLATNSGTQEGDTSITRFLQTQTNMFEMLGSPLLREENGVLAITRFSQSWQDWLTCEQFETDPANRRVIDEIRMCFSSACDIYLRRATCDSASNIPQHQAVEDLMNRVASIPFDGPGAHALVWPCFVACAEASEPHQREFFVNYMTSIYGRTRFRNIPLAVQNLESIWKRQGKQRWTQSLIEYNKVLVM